MTIHLYVQRPRGVPASLVSASMVLRAALMVAALTMAIVPVFAAQLRGDVLAANDVLTMADLVDGVSGPEAARPLFRSPALGDSGTIQVKRVLDAAASSA